uniref:MCF.2 cell line derived transforming sequence n=1 Tax=Nothobranchius furzeri TaxID=105023 RepID=A0A8C6KH96_NOTFU
MESYRCLLQAGSQLESTLQQVTVPVSLKEVGGYIEKQVAYLSGGRGEHSSVIITLPECSAFSDIPEEALVKVFTYLTLIPRTRQPGVKFIIILDRRLDTWASIKTALARIAASFPGNLHLVLVLRPTSFFHRTVTDIGFRFSQDDFMLKMPVVMLSSVTDLLRYIDENQLTSEFGGTLDYCHSDWIVLRTAIESFAVTVKDIAQMLQGFGTEVAETELPDEGKAIEHLLEIHTEKYRKLKVKLHARCITIHYWADVVFCCKNILCMTGRHQIRFKRGLLAQLRDMESAFDGFFEKHHLKLHQHLQLLRYEQSFQEMDLCLEHLMGQEKELSLNVNTLAQAEVALKKLDCLESNSQEVMSRAQIIILHGHQLSAGHHYALALIMQRCNELRHRCDSLSAALKTKHSFLMQTHQLLLCLGQAQTWCDDGAYMLANQLVDKSQSKEGAQVALREIEKFLEVAPSMLSSSLEVLSMEYEAVITPQLQVTPLLRPFGYNRNQPHDETEGYSKRVYLIIFHFLPAFNISLCFLQSGWRRQPGPPKAVRRGWRTCLSTCLCPLCCFCCHFLCDYLYSALTLNSVRLFTCHSHVMRELIETERIYVDELLSVLLGYRAEMDNPVLSGLLPPILRSKRDLLFGNMPEIYNFHSRVFLQDLEGCLEAPETVGACFLERKENFQMYEWYCQNKPRSEALWRQFSDCAFFHECQTKLEHKLGLDSYLLKPVQRLTKYQLLLKELLKYSPDCEGTSELQGALTAMLDLLKSVNDSMHQISITGYEGDICALGRVLMQGSFSVWISHKRGPTRMKELARFKPMQRHFFLYEKALLLCKRREEHGEGNNKTPSYSFKHCLKMTAVGITENVKGDVKKFEVWYSGREEVYVVQVRCLRTVGARTGPPAIKVNPANYFVFSLFFDFCFLIY